jgi:hypothetical protein
MLSGLHRAFEPQPGSTDQQSFPIEPNPDPDEDHVPELYELSDFGDGFDSAREVGIKVGTNPPCEFIFN